MGGWCRRIVENYRQTLEKALRDNLTTRGHQGTGHAGWVGNRTGWWTRRPFRGAACSAGRARRRLDNSAGSRPCGSVRQREGCRGDGADVLSGGTYNGSGPVPAGLKGLGKRDKASPRRRGNGRALAAMVSGSIEQPWFMGRRLRRPHSPHGVTGTAARGTPRRGRGAADETRPPRWTGPSGHSRRGRPTQSPNGASAGCEAQRGGAKRRHGSAARRAEAPAGERSEAGEKRRVQAGGAERSEASAATHAPAGQAKRTGHGGPARSAPRGTVANRS